MSRLKELASVYADEDTCIPVEYYGHSGNLTRGAVQRVFDDGTCKIVAYGGVLVSGPVITDRIAGPSAPEVWCLSRSAQAIHNSLSDPKYSEVADKSQQLLRLMWQQFGQFFDAKLALFKEWPGKDLLGIVGFIQISEGLVDRTGFIVYSDGRKPEFVRFLPVGATLTHFE